MVQKPFSRFIAIITGKGDPEGGDPITLEASLSRLERFAHFCALLWKSFVRNRCLVHASSLSFATLLALIPMLAVAISITSGLLKDKGEEKIYDFIDKAVAAVVPPATLPANGPDEQIDNWQPPKVELLDSNAVHLTLSSTNLLLDTTSTNGVVTTVKDIRMVSAQKDAAKYIHELIQNIRSGTIGFTGMILLVVVAIRMLSSIEDTFNDIWGVARGRSWSRRIWQYWGVITLGPFLLAIALGLASGEHFQSTKQLVVDMPLFGGLIFKLLPLVVLWLTFTLLYQVVPNTKVHFNAALFGGVIAGSLWHLNNVFGYLFVSRVVSNKAIYGSLFLLPVFMAGIYFSWLILLFGAQVAYAFQNRLAYLQEKLVENVNQRGREFIALRLMTCIGDRFQHGQPPVTIPEMSKELGVPSKLVQQVLRTLLAARLVVEVAKLEPAYSPARPLDAINAHHILMAMRSTSGQELITRDEPVRAEVYGEFARIQEAEKLAASTVTMLDLVIRAKARLAMEPAPDAKEPVKMVNLTPPAEQMASKPGAFEPVEIVTEVEKPEAKKSAPVTTKTGPYDDIGPVTPVATSSGGESDSFPL